MNPEKSFNPHNPEYKEVKDSPQENQKDFVDVEGGFVRNEAKLSSDDAEKLAAIANILKDTGLTGKDILHERALKEHYDKIDYEEGKKVVLEAVRGFGGAIEYAPEFQDDKDVALAAVQRYGGALRFVSERLKNDKDVVLAAIKNDPDAFRYASLEIMEEAEDVSGVTRDREREEEDRYYGRD